MKRALSPLLSTPVVTPPEILAHRSERRPYKNPKLPVEEACRPLRPHVSAEKAGC